MADCACFPLLFFLCVSEVCEAEADATLWHTIWTRDLSDVVLPIPFSCAWPPAACYSHDHLTCFVRCSLFPSKQPEALPTDLFVSLLPAIQVWMESAMSKGKAFTRHSLIDTNRIFNPSAVLPPSPPSWWTSRIASQLLKKLPSWPNCLTARQQWPQHVLTHTRAEILNATKS